MWRKFGCSLDQVYDTMRLDIYETQAYKGLFACNASNSKICFKLKECKLNLEVIMIDFEIASKKRLKLLSLNIL